MTERDGRMRVLFAVVPGLGHLFPTVPLAWALRAAGHDVLVATAGGGVAAATRAGLPVVDAAPGMDMGAFHKRLGAASPDLARTLRDHGEQVIRDRGRSPDFVLELYARISDAMADETLRVARYWQPDVVVHTRSQGAGLLAASALGIPAVEQGVNFIRDGGFAARYLPFLAETGARLGVPERLPEVETVHVAPPDLLIGEGAGWQMRYVPYNAGGVLPDWMWHPAGRPRVLVTLGTVVPGLAGFGGVSSLLAAAAEVDADFLLAFGDGVDTDAMGTLPANTRPIGWVPMYPLLAHCAAVVHHGGSGTTLTSLAAGVPQLVLPHATDQFLNAEVVATHGLGLRREPGDVDQDTLAELLGDDRLRVAARAAADQMRAQPAPSALVPRLAALAERASAAHSVARSG